MIKNMEKRARYAVRTESGKQFWRLTSVGCFGAEGRLFEFRHRSGAIATVAFDWCGARVTVN